MTTAYAMPIDDLPRTIALVSEGTCPFCNVKLNVQSRAWFEAWARADPDWLRRMKEMLPVDQAGRCGRCESFWWVATMPGTGKPGVGSLSPLHTWTPGVYAAKWGPDGANPPGHDETLGEGA